MKSIIPAVVLLLILYVSSSLSQTPLDEAISLYHKGLIQEAREKFRQLLAEDPQGAEILYYLGKIELDADRSLEYRQRFLSLYPRHPKAAEVLYGVAQYNFAMGYYLTAAKDYQSLLRSYPSSDLVAEALYWLASSKLAIGAADSAGLYFRKLLKDHKESSMVPWAQLGLVDVSFMQQNFPVAHSLCDAFLEAHHGSPLVPVALFRLAEIDEALGTRDEAKAVLRRLVSDYPQSYQGEQARRQLTEWGEQDEQQAGHIETESEGKYAVQVGAFSKRGNAVNLQTQLSTAGYQVEVVKKAGQHRNLYLVWVGSYQDRDEALKEARMLEKQYGLPYQVIRR